MLHVLLSLQRSSPVTFRLLVMNLDQKQPGFPAEVLPAYFEQLRVEYRIVEVDTYSIVKEKIPDGKTTCSLCSRLRRGLIYRTASEMGASKIALGHHRDDVVHTLFLNLLFGGKLKAMPPKLLSDDGANVVIRPLAYCNEDDIARFARGMGFPIIPCNLCGTQDNLQRQKIREMMQEWERHFPGRCSAVFTALQNVTPSHLADTRLFDFKSLTSVAGTAEKAADKVVAGSLSDNKLPTQLYLSASVEDEIAVVFADIVGSTSLYLEFGDQKAFAAISACKQYMQEALATYEGQLVKTLGDGIIASFANPEKAIHAAIAMQRNMQNMQPGDTGSLHLKVSVHFGKVLREGDDIYGDTVNLAARLLEECRSGQILTTLTTMLQCEKRLRSRAFDLGNKLVKGRPEEINLFEIPWRRENVKQRKDQPDARFANDTSAVGMTMRWREEVSRVNSKTPVINLGSDPTCEIHVADPTISPYHARVELRTDGFYLVDHSNTGTILTQTGEAASIHLRHEEAMLRQDGYFFLGDHSPDEPDYGIHYLIE